MKSFFAVKIQDSGGHLTDVSQWVDERAMQGKMVCPMISARIKEPHQLTGSCVESRYVQTSPGTAHPARQWL
jgi:hypothetical protein